MSVQRVTQATAEFVSLLLEHKAEVLLSNNRGETVLHLAAVNSRSEVVDILRKKTSPEILKRLLTACDSQGLHFLYSHSLCVFFLSMSLFLPPLPSLSVSLCLVSGSLFKV